MKNHQLAAAAHGISPKSRKKIEVTITTDGTWFTLHGDKKDDAGFELHFSTDGGNAEVSVHTNEPATPLPALRLYLDRPA